jgi:hypothetical protein
MIVTRPIPLSFLTNPSYFTLGRRVQKLLREPFDKEVLHKRIMRTTRDKSRGVAAYYIDSRGLDERLDWVVGLNNWEIYLEAMDMGDRIAAKCALTIGGITKEDVHEEIKDQTRWDTVLDIKNIEHTESWKDDDDKEYSRVEKWTETTKVMDPTDATGQRVLSADQGRRVPKDIVLLRCGPNAYKRAAVHFGAGAYLYNFRDAERWEDLTDWGRKFKQPDIIMANLPAWAQPTPGWAMVLEELAYLCGLELPEGGAKAYTADDSDASELMALLDHFWGIDTLKEGLGRCDYFELAGCIARMSDHMDHRLMHTRGDLDPINKINSLLDQYVSDYGIKKQEE